MKRFLETVLSVLRQDESIKIEADSSSVFSVRHMGYLTVFDAVSKKVRRPGKTNIPFSAIGKVRIRKISDGEGGVYWAVLIRLTHDRKIQIGRSSEDMEASIVAAKIAGITGAKVAVAD